MAALAKAQLVEITPTVAEYAWGIRGTDSRVAEMLVGVLLALAVTTRRRQVGSGWSPRNLRRIRRQLVRKAHKPSTGVVPTFRS